MFNRTQPAPDPVDLSDDSIPLSHLALDLPAPGEGWNVFLAGRDIAVVIDDIGREAISRPDARQLLDERREAEARRREVLRAADAAAEAFDREQRARQPRGVPWYLVPADLSPAEFLMGQELASRTSVHEELLAAELAHLNGDAA